VKLKKGVTVFTPTYNREKVLYGVYESLKKQSNYNFEWLIVDDGSIDETKSLVEKWIGEGIIDIKYIFQENQGKTIAHNTGVKNAQYNLFFCVDSDDSCGCREYVHRPYDHAF
jgi:glycosyltransferase involved in cell wall biosynthesis